MNNKSNNINFPILSVLQSRPRAIAEVKGSSDYPDITGTVKFYQTNVGVILYAVVRGLPTSADSCSDRIFGFHIHEGTDCGGNMDDPFADAMKHYNPDNCEHPYHAGDLPSLFENNGLAVCLVLTDRFLINDVIGKTVIIHDHSDDFTTQPSGNSGTKIACGVIKRNCARR